MSGRAWDREYGSHPEFYEAVYGHAIRSVMPAGRVGARLMTVEQEAGDWSDAPTPDLVIGVVTLGTPVIEGDIGAGYFKTRCRSGDWSVQPPYSPSRSQIDSPHGFRILSVPYAALVGLVGEDGPLPSDGDFGKLHGSAQRSPEVPAILKAMWTEAAAASVGGALWADGAMLQLAAHLVRAAQLPEVAPSGGLAPWQVRRVSEYLEHHLAEDVSLADLAGLLDLSTFHLCRAFKQSTGLPPHRWRQQRRMERAREVLDGTNDPISDVAAAIGYDDPSQFAAAFRKAFGVTPSQYRRERRS